MCMYVCLQQLKVSMRQINYVLCTYQKFIFSYVRLPVWLHVLNNMCVGACPVQIPLCVMCVASSSLGLAQAMLEMIQGGAEGA